MPRIESVTIRRFKRLPEITLAIPDVLLLVGANNSGKSSILQAIHFAVSVAQSARLIGEGVAWANDAFKLSINPSQLIYSPVADVLSLASGGRLEEAVGSRIEIEFHGAGAQKSIVAVRRGRNRNISLSIEGRQLGEHLMDLAHPFTVYAPGLAGIAKEERYISPGVVRRIVARGDANLVLRNVLRMLSSDAGAWAAFLADMRSLFSDIDIQLQFNPDIDETIEAWFRLGGGPRLPVDAAGTSILQAAQIVAYISLFKPKVLILDEPDSHLHPNNQRALCDLICRLAVEREFQALISTHSRHVLDALKGRSGLAWLSQGKLVEDADATTTTVLLDLGALDSVDYFADGAIRCVVATEDADFEPLRAVLLSNGFADEDTAIHSYTGCSKVEAALVLGGFLREKAPHLKLVIHRDRDYMGVEHAARFTQNISDAGLLPLLTDGNDVESYFLSAEHLHTLNPTVTAARIGDLIEQATVETRNDSIAAIVNQRTHEAYRKKRDEGGGGPDHGSIAVTAQADYDANPAQMRRGKSVLGRLAALLQAELASNPRIYHPSEHLARPALQAMSAGIWAGAGGEGGEDTAGA